MSTLPKDMSYDFEQLFIEVIQKYPFLFDKTSRDFKNCIKKKHAWQTIATAMSSTVEELQRLWKTLRERYAKTRRAMKNKDSEVEASEIEWPLYKRMSFMDKHINSRKRFVSRPSTSQPSMSSTPIVSSSVWPIVHHTEENEIDHEEEIIESKDLVLQRIESPIPKKIKRNDVILLKSKESALKNSVQKTLDNITSYSTEKSKHDKNMVFGQYVGLSLVEMPANEQNFKRLKIVEILNQPFEV